MDTVRTAIGVFLVDEQEVVRRGIIAILREAPGITITGEAENASAALARIPTVRPDIALLPVRMPGGDGLAVCRLLRSRVPALKVLMLGTHGDDEPVAEAFSAGASGYLLRDVGGPDLLRAVRIAAAGGLVPLTATPAVVERVFGETEPTAPLSGLTDRERAVLDLLAGGLSNREIGARMYLAEKTVTNAVSGLLAKLGLQRRSQAAALVAGQCSRAAAGRPGTSPGSDTRIWGSEASPLGPGTEAPAVRRFPTATLPATGGGLTSFTPRPGSGHPRGDEP